MKNILSLHPTDYPPSLKLRRTKGEMAERSNAAVLKTVVLLSWDRGFESLFLRQNQHLRPAALLRVFCFTRITSHARMSEESV